VNKNEVETFEGNKLFGTNMILKHFNNKFSSLYRMKENISLDEALILWKGRQGIPAVHSLEGCQIQNKVLSTLCSIYQISVEIQYIQWNYIDKQCCSSW
jgi:hypothetical protein